MAGDELDELFCVAPEEFTALRARLADAAKTRGDAAVARSIAAARKPTTAAWVVNRLAHTNEDATRSLADLGDRLRAAHAAMDGATIRELSAEQRSLVDELARAAFEGADMPRPSAALREDVTGTLQAAIADPEVRDRIGRLTKAEKWSGFADFGATTAVSSTARSRNSKTAEPKPTPHKSDKAGPSARALEEAKAALAAAERAKDEADDELSDKQTDLAVARLRRDEMQERLEEADRNLRSADEAFNDAKRVSSDAADRVKKARARLKDAQRAK